MKQLFWGGAIIAVGLASGNSVFLGDFSVLNVVFDALGTYWVARGLMSLVDRPPLTQAAPGAPAPGYGSPAEAASRMLANIRATYGKEQVLVPAGNQRFARLDEGCYEQLRRGLEGKGFVFLGDFVLPAVNDSPTTLLAPTKIRACVSKDGQVVAEYYQVHPRIGRRLKALLRGLLNLRWIAAPRDFLKNLRMRHNVGFETEFSDGTFLTTSNATMAGKLSLPASIESRFLPQSTGVRELLAMHESRLYEISQETPSRAAVPVRSVADLLAMQRRLSTLKAAHRAAINWLSRSEVEAFSGGNRRMAEEVFSEIQKQVRAERAQP